MRGSIRKPENGRSPMLGVEHENQTNVGVAINRRVHPGKYQ
jgi:hypothetical protein